MLRHAFLAASLLLLVAPACHHESDGPAQGADSDDTLLVPLHVIGEPAAVGAVAIGSDFTIDPVVVELEGKAIGANWDRGVQAKAIGDTPGEFMDRVLRRQMDACGVNLQSPTSATRHIHIRLTRFFVEEANVYHGEVAATVEVRDASGQVLNSHAVSGRGRTWGITLNPKNYSEVLNRAAFDFAKNLLSDKDLFAVTVPPPAPSSPSQ